MPTARERARAQTTEAILAAARTQLAEVGAAALSLRAVAREVGMVSSAVYRYFPSRDELLTALIIEAYDDVGEAAEAAAALVAGRSPRERWLAVWRSVRAWGLEHPAQYALIYGSPVPGYAAPQDTLPAAGRVGVVLGAIATAADGGVVGDDDVAAAVAPDVPGTLGIDPRLAPAAVSAWTLLFGTVGFELFGQYENVVIDREAYFDHVAGTAATSVGIG
ncbi:TetR/AcrR family transcriptional regulator [Actinomycetospora endophytica]|uniref:TetR/AcrR family transcriptional regulator n=1 Tax=Actinomycetospora endophytica TaxID=2291215 RepID=A0ABS8PID9_9PSEU|nr:TetR/AcrR family transcriptional regulator [Actinomycetospora endophytica]MCD2197156.1 TetR/AcrR family transcriptional regulator [Actinomycetospora endophytica]